MKILRLVSSEKVFLIRSSIMASSNISLKKDGGDFQRLTLWPSQSSHFNRMVEVLNQFHACYDTSETGSGKTHVALALCLAFQLKLFVVAPKSLLEMWKEKASLYGIELISVLTYETLRGSPKRCNHDFLTISNDGPGHQQFSPTDKLKNEIMDGCFFVFDEAHRAKNSKTKTHSSIHSIVSAVVGSNSRSRISFLSASPCDKKDQAKSLLQLMGLTQEPNMYVYDRSNMTYDETGINDIYRYCRR